MTLTVHEGSEKQQVLLFCRVLGISKAKDHKDTTIVKALKEKILAKALTDTPEATNKQILQAVKIAAEALLAKHRNAWSPFDLSVADLLHLKKTAPIIKALMVPQSTEGQAASTVDELLSSLDDLTPPVTPELVATTIQTDEHIDSPNQEPTTVTPELEMLAAQTEEQAEPPNQEPSPITYELETPTTQTEEQIDSPDQEPTPQPCLALAIIPAPEQDTAVVELDAEKENNPQQVEYIATHKWRYDKAKKYTGQLEFQVKFKNAPSTKRTTLADMTDHQEALKAYFNDKAPIRHPKSKRMYKNARNTLYERLTELRHLFDHE